MNTDLYELSRRFQNYAEEIEAQLPEECVLPNHKKFELAFSLTYEPNGQTRLLQDYLHHRKRFAKTVSKDPYLAYSLILLLRFYAGTLRNMNNLFPSKDDSELLSQLCFGNEDAFSKTLRAVALHLSSTSEPSGIPDNQR